MSVCQALRLKCEQNKKFAALVRTMDPYPHVACVYIWLAQNRISNTDQLIMASRAENRPFLVLVNR